MLSAQAADFSGLPEVLTGQYRAVAAQPYLQSRDAYRSERCRVSLYLPATNASFPTLVWLHGGGLTGGAAHLPEGLREQGIGVAVVEYRLAPQASVTEIIDDAAAAVAWVMDTIPAYGGSDSLVFVAGHSAGGYLTSMIVMDSTRLLSFGVSPQQLAGAVPLSGHTVTHFTERAARQLSDTQIVADSLAPIFYVRDRTPPVRLITGDRDLELLGRYEENAFFWRMMRVAGHPDCELFELEGYGHNMVVPAMPLVVEFVHQRARNPSSGF